MSRLRLRATPVGDALLVHPRGRVDERAADFAGGLARDPHHTLVVVDLPAGSLADEWRAVAKILSSPRHGSLRIVFGRERGEDVRRAAGLIAERIGREVLAADGALTPTAAGGLFVPGDGTAWLRFRPGRTAERDSQRFPRPDWEFSLPLRARSVGTHTVAQPIPSGVWLRHTDRGRVADRYRRAVTTTATDPRRLLVVIGSPGTPPLPVEDVARYWDSVLPTARTTVRFHLYGTVDAPDSVTPGQYLADVLGHEVVLYAELPTGAAGAADDDTLAYLPAHGAVPMTMTMPMRGAAESGTEGASPATAVGATGTGLPAELGGAGTRAGTAGGAETSIDLGSGTPEPPAAAPAPRPAARVQTETGRATPPAAVRETPAPPTGEPESGSTAAPGATETPSAAPSPTGSTQTPRTSSDPGPSRELDGAGELGEAGELSESDEAGAIGEIGEISEISEIAESDEPGENDEPDGVGGVPGVGGGGESGGFRGLGGAGESGKIPGSDGAGESGRFPGVDGADESSGFPELGGAGGSEGPGGSEGFTAAGDAAERGESGTSPGPGGAAGVGGVPEAGVSTGSSGSAARVVRPAAPRFRLESGTPAAEPAPPREPVQGQDQGQGQDPALESAPVPAPPDAAAAVRVQPVPGTAACAIPPERGIARERDWIRQTFSDQYNAIAGSVSRVMSESPGLRGGSKAEAAEALTDLVAVRLYLSGDSSRADAAVRTATAGPHVPLARCVAAGLRRLPSHRGPVLLRTRLNRAERAWYQDGRLVTEWAFCHARTSLHTGPRGTGATDVLIWSMTARRTASLDPDLSDRVLFLPGTVFKVLRTDGDAVLMRELSPSETDRSGGVAAQPGRFDEMALRGLGNILDALEKAGTDAVAQSAAPPGLVLAPHPARTGRPEGARP
ncbi:hypothetical protein [Streptomyces sp. NPDC093970]|uniref:hypothetical protein n=1 Tax=Streptomyces sp. NPDC093970 TaxID=3155076 RepID=UPI00344A60AB